MTLPFSMNGLRQALPAISIRHHIFTGGQKHVFRCRVQGADGALKILSRTATAEARAEREVEAMRLANSPNLVKMLSDQLRRVRIEGNDYVYFVEEFVEGNDLSDLISADWTYAAIVGLIQDLVNAVQELWTHRIVHRDIKPRNVRIRPHGQAVLLDVGLACHLDRSTLTSPFQVPGTYGYHSPEQLRQHRRKLDFRSDLFVIGVCVYELIAKTNPLTAGIETDDEYFERVLHVSIPPIEAADPNIPLRLGEFIGSLLKPYPNLRPRSFRAIHEFLNQVQEVVRCRS